MIVHRNTFFNPVPVNVHRVIVIMHIFWIIKRKINNIPVIGKKFFVVKDRLKIMHRSARLRSTSNLKKAVAFLYFLNGFSIADYFIVYNFI